MIRLLVILMALVGAQLATIQPVLAQTASPTAAPPNHAPTMLDTAQQSVIKIRTSDSAVGTGFIVSHNGLVITNYHVVQYATAAEATLVRGGRSVRLELIDAQPSYDLALLQLIPAPASSDRFIPLKVADAVPAPGAEVWSLGFPKTGFTITRGIVSAIRPFLELPDSTQRHMRFDRASVWIQTDCAINRGNSGGPLLNHNGEVVGVNTWFMSDENDAYFALSAEFIRDLVTNHTRTPVTFTKHIGHFQSQPLPRSSFPNLDIPKDKASKEVRAAITTFKISYKCNGCDGTCEIVVRERSGSRNANGMIYPVFTKSTKPCKACDATGLASTDKIFNLAGRVITLAARLREDDPERLAAFGYLKDVFQQAMKLSPAAWDQKLTDYCTTRMTDTTFEYGDALLLIGKVSEDFSTREGMDRYISVKVGNKSLEVLMVSPHTIDATVGELVLCGGLLTGRLDAKDGVLVPVLTDGFVVAQRRE